MATTAAETVPAKPEMVENGSKTCGIPKEANGETGKEKGNSKNGTKVVEEPTNEKTQEKEEAQDEEVPTEIEPKSGVSFPVRLSDGKQLSCVGMRKKSMLGMGIKVYGFGNILSKTTFTQLASKIFDSLGLNCSKTKSQS